MSQKRDNEVGRRRFIKEIACGAALGTSYLAFGDVAAALARPRVLRWTRPAPGGGQFTMVVLGDSIMWGQGLREEAKFTTLVANWIESQLPGWRVSTHRYAHSGAVIKPNEEKDARPATPGEVPNPYPSITALFWKGAGELTPEPSDRTVDLVLMDGGINDVKVNSIITTDPTITNKVEWVTKLTRERCAPRLQRLLPYVLQKFPSSKVVTTSYYPIVSRKSDLTELARIVSLYNPARRILTVTDSLRDALARQSRAFHDTYVSTVPRVVRQAKPLEAVARVAGIAKRSAEEPSRTIAVSDRTIALDPSARRTAFALVPFKPENSYGAPETWLWKLGEEDHVATTRRQQCFAAGFTPAVNPTCYLASMGHPNVAGAKAYASAIISELRVFVPQWQEERQIEAPKIEPRTDLRTRIGSPVRR